MAWFEIDASGLSTRDLNIRVREALSAGEREIRLLGVNGQRFICDGLMTEPDVRVDIRGVPGNDLGAFMAGPSVRTSRNAQDGVGNTMNSGKIVVRGSAGDLLGYGMRGGRIFVGGNVGYRVGIHMKEYRENVPVIVVGGKAGAFLGEYMAGGILVVLGLNARKGQMIAYDYLGTGMHGGVIYLRGTIPGENLGREVRRVEMETEDEERLGGILTEFGRDLGVSADEIFSRPFLKFVPLGRRPYGRLYYGWSPSRSPLISRSARDKD